MFFRIFVLENDNHINYNLKNTQIMKKFFLLMLCVAGFSVSCGDNSDDGASSSGDPVLVVSPTRDITFNAIDNNEVLFTVTTNVAEGWDIEAVPDWIIVTSKTERNLKIKVAENKQEERSHDLVFTAGAAAPVHVKISQQGGNMMSASLKGSDYYIIFLDSESSSVIEDKIKVDYRNKYEFQVWNGYDGGARQGLNSYEKDKEWTCLTWKSAGGWCGAGFLAKVDVDWSGLTREHVFHFAIKGSGTHVIRLGGVDQYKIVVGDRAMEDTDPIGTVTDEWVEYEVSVGDMMDAGWTPYVSTENPANMMSFGTDVSDGQNFMLNLDALFFYIPEK